jgi:hypothetical protein
MEDNNKKSNTCQDGGKKDENIGVMVYGNLKIVDVDTGEILVNKRT